MRIHFAIDFDGTVTLEDTTDVLLDRLADPAWLIAEAEWLAGRIGSRECLARQAALLHATPAQIDAALADIRIDLDFAAFVHMARMTEATMEILSDGFDRCILPALKRTGVQIPVTCNRLYPVGGGRWAAAFPAYQPDCTSASGLCKCRAAETERLLVLIGDGRSDFCLASQADFVLAKGGLATHCTQHKLPCKPINGFADVLEWLQRSPVELPCETAFRP